MRGSKALEYLAASPWAIRPEMMEVGRSILLGEGIQPEAVSTRDGRKMDGSTGVTIRDGVAIIEVVGPIFRYADWMTDMCGGATVESLAKDLRSALDNGAVRAVLIHFDTPGGEAAGIGELAGQIREGTTRKPIVAYVGSQACSAGYWLAAACSEVVVAPTGILGSIGVVMAYPRKKDDPKTAEFVSSQSPMKRPDIATPDGRDEVQRTVDAMAKVFVDSVADYRGSDSAKVANDFGRGGVKVGADAVSAGMADRMGTFEAVLTQLASGYAPTPPMKQPASNPAPVSKAPKVGAFADRTPSKGSSMPNFFTRLIRGAVAQTPEGEDIDVDAIKAIAALGDPAPTKTLHAATAEFRAATIDIQEHPQYQAMKARAEAAEASAKTVAESEVATFVASLVKSERLLPAQSDSAKGLLIQLAADDRANPLASGSRLEVGKKLLDGNAKNGLLSETATADASGNTRLPAGAKIVPSTTDKRDPKTPMSQDELDKMLCLTDEGAAIVAARKARLGK